MQPLERTQELQPGDDARRRRPRSAPLIAAVVLCQSVHGGLLQKTQWMLHAWVVPGYEDR
jgi:hypothetical protein